LPKPIRLQDLQFGAHSMHKHQMRTTIILYYVKRQHNQVKKKY